jgi:hypothetical protein
MKYRETELDELNVYFGQSLWKIQHPLRCHQTETRILNFPVQDNKQILKRVVSF